MSEQQQVQVAQVESTTGEEPKWGELPPPERIAELEARLVEWEQLPKETRGDPAKGEGRSAFDREGPQAWKEGLDGLSGADVFYLAARMLNGSAESNAIAAAAKRLLHSDMKVPMVLSRLELSALHLEGADLSYADLRSAYLRGGFLAGASLVGAHLDGAHLREAHLEGVILRAASLELAWLGKAHLEDANLRYASLAGAYLTEAHLEGADLTEAHLEDAHLSGTSLAGANLAKAHLEGADLRSVWLDGTTVLNEAILDTTTSLGDIQWGGVGAVNLTQVLWERVRALGDECGVGMRASAGAHEAVVRAYRQVAAQLRAQGMNEVADRFLLRAQIRQRRVLFRQMLYAVRRPWRLPGAAGRYLFSWVLAGVAGYGYRPGRTLFWYVITVFGFAVAYYLLGPAQGHAFQPDGALVFSVTSFHGRGFFPGGLDVEDTVTKLAAAEAVIGLFIEISFIATFTQRYFGAR
jgi:uncharacterized protein YjbI with pentapeptide repeats